MTATASPALEAEPTKLEPAEPHTRGSGTVAVRIVWGVTIAAVAALYIPTLLHLAALWKVDPNYSHGPLVVLAAGFFAWIARKDEAEPHAISARETSRGFALVMLGLVIHFVAWLANQAFIDTFGLVLLLWGCMFLAGGKPAWQRYSFAATFLLFMAPLPPLFLHAATITMQQFVAATSATILELAGAAVFREGYLVHLPGFTMEVGQACSGMRQLVAFAALGAAVGHLSRRGGWFTSGCIALALACALVANVLRVLLTGLVFSVAGPKYASGVFHTLEGLLTFLLGVTMLLAACLGIARLLDSRSNQEAHT